MQHLLHPTKVQQPSSLSRGPDTVPLQATVVLHTAKKAGIPASTWTVIPVLRSLGDGTPHLWAAMREVRQRLRQARIHKL